MLDEDTSNEVAGVEALFLSKQSFKLNLSTLESETFITTEQPPSLQMLVIEDQMP